MSNDGQDNPLNIDSSQFDSDAYLSYLLKKKSLDELVQVEEDMVHNVHRLDSEMQQLVYENYNKFLTATSTVKKMQSDFCEMSREMESISARMGRISDLSRNLSDVLGKHRGNISRLTQSYNAVKGLQSLFTLPQKLKNFNEQKEYANAVKLFLDSEASLSRYNNISSITAIREECLSIMDEIQEQLRKIVGSPMVSTESLSEAVTLLLQLGRPSTSVHSDFIISCRHNLEDQLETLQLHDAQLKKDGTVEDVLEFVDSSCSNFLTELSLFTALNQRLFGEHSMDGEVIEMVDALMARLEELVRTRFLQESDARECAIVVRALDRFYRRISSCNQLIPGVDYAPVSLSMLHVVSRHEISLARQQVIEYINKTITEVRRDVTTASCSHQENCNLREFATKLENALLVQLKTALASLLLFTASDMTFSSLDPAVFSTKFGVDVHEELVVAALKDVSNIGRLFYEGENGTANVTPALIIVLAQFFTSVEQRSVTYISDLCREQFRISSSEREKTPCITSTEEVRVLLRATAHSLLQHYVHIQGSILSQLLVKSLEVRDWLSCAEPTAVRTVVKRLLEDVKILDACVKTLMSDGVRKDRTTENARSHARRNPNYETCSISSTLDKLWSERIDLCAKIECNRTSVLTALVNLTLKSFLEAVRLQTFSKCGLQQIQVDCYYLQQSIWEFVTDEHITVTLLDEIVSSAVQRCIDPKLLDPATVQAICERI